MDSPKGFWMFCESLHAGQMFNPPVERSFSPQIWHFPVSVIMIKSTDVQISAFGVIGKDDFALKQFDQFFDEESFAFGWGAFRIENNHIAAAIDYGQQRSHRRIKQVTMFEERITGYIKSNGHNIKAMQKLCLNPKAAITPYYL